VTIVGAPHVVSIDPTVGSFPVVVNNGRIGRVGVDKLTISVLLVATSGGATVNKMLGFVTTGRVGKLVIVVVAALLIVAERFDGVVGARGDNLLEIMLVDVGSTGSKKNVGHNVPVPFCQQSPDTTTQTPQVSY